MPPDSAVAASTRSDPCTRALRRARHGPRPEGRERGLLRAWSASGRPLPEMLREAVRIHAPYTHVPYHERMDDGYVNFVNNDHCLLSAARQPAICRRCCRAARRACRWRRPSGTCRPASTSGTRRSPRRPGHYARGFQMPDGPPPVPVVHWPDQEPQRARRPAEGPAGPLDDPGASRPGDRRLPRLPRPDGEPGRAPRGAGRALLRRPDRRAGPLLPQPLLHDRPQVLPRPRHRRAGRGDRLGRRARRALCRRARHRRRPALVLALRGGVQRHH